MKNLVDKLKGPDGSFTLKGNTWQSLVLNLAIIAAIGLLFLLGFFYMYLPLVTHHNESITVPKIENMALERAIGELEDRDLRYVVTDSTYDPKLPPLTVIKQDPQANAKVKVNRRIHLTVNATMPPMETVPNIIDNSMRQADMILESYGFKRGTVKFVPDPIANTVLKISVKGREISREQLRKGFALPKGSVIDIEVGDGMGTTEFDLPNVVGKPMDEVEFILRGIGLGIGNITYEPSAGKPAGTVLRQKPAYAPGTKVRVGEVIDLWVVGQDSETIEDND